jgi:hypothetical protein
MQLQFLLEEAALVTIFKTARRIATNLISSKTTETYSLVQHVADEASSSQVAVVIASRYTTCQRTSLTKRVAYDSSLNMDIVQLMLGRANMNVARQLEGFTKAAKPRYRSRLYSACNFRTNTQVQ